MPEKNRVSHLTTAKMIPHLLQVGFAAKNVDEVLKGLQDGFYVKLFMQSSVLLSL